MRPTCCWVARSARSRPVKENETFSSLSSSTFDRCMMEGRRLFDACLFFMLRYFHLALTSVFVCAFLSLTSSAQNTKQAGGGAPSGKQAVNLAKAGHCKEALPGLKRAAQHDADAALKR